MKNSSTMRKCRQCGIEFSTASKIKIYCSGECNQKAKIKRFPSYFKKLRASCSKRYVWKNRRTPIGEKTYSENGYVLVFMPDHPRASRQGKVLEHIVIAEKAIGKPLPPGAQVHHHDEVRSNNEPTNLIICPDDAYHKLLHMRMRALDACGNTNFIPCIFCKTHDDPSNLTKVNIPRGRSRYYHKKCNTQYWRNYMEKKARA